MKKLMSVKEFSELSGVEQSTLRYWDSKGLFSPVHRLQDNKYRRYDPAQLIPLNFVTTLSELNVQLKTISELEEERSPKKFIELIDNQEKLINEELRKLRTCYAIMHTRRELVSFGEGVDESQVGVMYRDEKRISLGPRNEYKEGETFVDALAPLVRESKDLHINLSFPVGGYYESVDSFINAPKQPEYFFTIDPIGTRARKAGDYLIGFYRGYYGEFGDLPQRMAAYAEENSIKATGPVYVIYLHDEICIKNKDEYLAQCCVTISKDGK